MDRILWIGFSCGLCGSAVQTPSRFTPSNPGRREDAKKGNPERSHAEIVEKRGENPGVFDGIDRILRIGLSANSASLRFNVLSYYNFKGMGGVHSGDIVDAPKGASEFIDVSLTRLLDAGIRYVVMTLHSYTQQPYVDLPECFAGWMSRARAGSGEVYEPKTVQDRLDLTANTRIAVPLLIDVAERQVVWCDLALKNSGCLRNNVATSRGGTMRTLQSLIHVAKPNLYDLFVLHVRARGERVATPKEGERVFSPESGIAFRHEEIASEFL